MKNRPHSTPVNNHRTSENKLFLKKSFFLCILCLLIAASLLLIASRSSPLYPFNDWVDVNTFFTLGKGMVHGKVPYRDLFDHKGPLLYLFYGIASLISSRSFFGVYILEVISFSVFLFFCAATLSLFMDRKYALLTLPVLAASLINLRSFAYGGTAELFSFPFMIATLYTLILYFTKHYPDPIPLKWGVVHGILAGCVLWIKYSFLGFWLGWGVIIIITALFNKQFINALKYCLLFLVGLFLATLPWIAYFGINGAISDWFQAYYVVNLTAYASDNSLLEILQTTVDSFQRHLQFNPLALGLLTLGVLLFATLRNLIKSWWFAFGLLLSIGLLGLGVYAGGKDYIYYFLIFAPFIIFGFIHLSHLYHQSFGTIRPKLLFGILLIISLSLSAAYTFCFNRNKDLLQTNQEDLVQFQFAEIINQSQDPSLLNFGFQDGGFYTTSDTLPNVKYFQKYNFQYGHFPINMDEQNRYIQEKLVEYVVIRYPASESPDIDISLLQENYQQLVKESQNFGEQEFIYALFHRK